MITTSFGNNGQDSTPEQVPPTEVKAKAERRRFTAKYKQQILREADKCTKPGELSALLRRERLYSSHLSTWRAARDRGELAGLTPKKRGPKAKEKNPLDKRVRELEREVVELRKRAERAEAAAPYAALPRPAYLLALDGAGHFTFSDMCELLDMVGLSVEQFDDGCSEENVPSGEAHAVIERDATAFLQLYVAGDARYRPFLSEVGVPAGAWLESK